MSDLIERLLNGSPRALARFLTQVENQTPGIERAMRALYPHTGKAWIIGVTGAPGTGKSSLVNALIRAYRQQNKSIGVIAVDPTSPFSGGAILGDRIRMREHAGDSGVFIRSMATRGSLGGLAPTTRDMVRTLDAAGFDIVLIETVGAGQSEVEVVRIAQTTIVVEAPGLGDDVQAIKAGILEIADVLVVNKSDRAGADQTVRILQNMLTLGHPVPVNQFTDHHGQVFDIDKSSSIVDAPLWKPPVIKTVATDETLNSIQSLVDAIADHHHHLETNNLLSVQEQNQLQVELYERLRESLIAQLTTHLDHDIITDTINRIQSREITPQEAVTSLLLRYNQIISAV